MPHEEKIQLKTEETEKIEEITEETPKENPSFWQTKLWKDLKFPLVWLQCIYIVLSVLLIYTQSERLEIDLSDGKGIFLDIIFGALTSMALFLLLPLFVRFIILKRPLKRRGLPAFLITLALYLFTTLPLIVVLSIYYEVEPGSLPIFHIYAAYRILTAGYEPDDSPDISPTNTDEPEKA